MTVYVCSTHRRRDVTVYHTDTGCHNFPAYPQERDKSELDGYRECKACTGNREFPDEWDYSYQEALREASNGQ